MTGRRPARTAHLTATDRLDWSHARLGDPAPCQLCGQLALLRHPVTNRPCHKVCSDAQDGAARPGRAGRLITTNQ